MKASVFSFLFLCIALISPAQDGWERMADMDIGRMYFGSCLLDDRIYVFGTTVPGDYSYTTTEAYDIPANKWFQLSSYPRPVNFQITCAVNNFIYNIGGFYDQGAGGAFTDQNFQYNPLTDGWLPKKSCPSLIGESAGCLLNGKIYLFGGDRDIYSLLQKNTFLYDPEEDSWEKAGQTIFFHTDGDAVAVNGRAFIIGGAEDTMSLDLVIYYLVHGKSEKYDPGADQFTEIRDMPFAVSGHASVVHNNRILVFGGDTGNYIYNHWNATNLIQEYDPVTDSWRLLKGMPFTRFECRAEVKDDFVYIIGGQDTSGQISKEVWRFDLSYLEPLALSDTQESVPESEFGFRMYPNPAIARVNLEFQGDNIPERIELFDMDGKLLCFTNLQADQFLFTFDISCFREGIYYMRMVYDHGSASCKLIKKSF